MILDSSPTPCAPRTPAGRWIRISLFTYAFLVTLLFRSQFQITVTDTEFLSAKADTLPSLADLRLWLSPSLAQWRPIEQWIICAEQKWFGTEDFTPVIVIQGLILGWVAVAAFSLARHLGERARLEPAMRDFVAAAAALSFIQSIHVIEVTWLILHKSLMAELYVLTGLVALHRYLADGRARWLVVMGIMGFFGPMTRELPTALAMVVFVVAALRFREDKRLAIFAACLMAHATFPAFLPTLLAGIFPPNTSPIFGSSVQRGLLVPSDQGLPGLFPAIHRLHPDIPFRTALYISPLAMIGLFVSIFLFVLAGSLRHRKALAIGVALTLLLSLLAIYVPGFSLVSLLAPVCFTVVVAVAGWRFGPILPCLFVLPLLPFVVVPVYDVWLRLPAAAYIMIALLWIAEIPVHARACRERFAGAWRRILDFLALPSLPHAVVGFVALCTFPHLVMSLDTFSSFINLDTRLIKFLRDASSGKTVVVSNLRQTFNLEWYSGAKIDTYYLTFDPSRALPPDGPMPGGAGGRMGTLMRNLKSYHAAKATPPRLFFIVNEEFGRQGFPSLPPASLRTVGEFPVKFSYFFLDPFQHGLPEKYIRFAGPTDLQFQGRFTQGFFHFNYHALFTLYEYTGDYPTLEAAYFKLPATSGHAPRYWWEHRLFSIKSDGPTLYACVPYIDGPYDTHRLLNQPFSVLITGKSLEDIIPKIDAYIAQPSTQADPRFEPTTKARINMIFPSLPDKPVSAVSIVYTGAPGPMRVEVGDERGVMQQVAEVQVKPIPLDTHEEIVVPLTKPVLVPQLILSVAANGDLPFRVFAMKPTEAPKVETPEKERPAAVKPSVRPKHRSTR